MGRSHQIFASLLLVAIFAAPAASQDRGWVVAPGVSAAFNTSFNDPTETTLVRLPDGRLLAAGGQPFDTGQATTAAKVFGMPGLWTPIAPMNTARSYAAGVLLNDGRVMVIGGQGPTVYWWDCYSSDMDFFNQCMGALSSVEFYDPASGTWTTGTAPMSTQRIGARAIVLKDGRVLVIGGYKFGIDCPWSCYLATNIMGSAEIYDPVHNTWTPAAPTDGVWGQSYRLYLLGDGRVVGWNQSWTNAPSIYNPSTDSWSAMPGYEGRLYTSAAILPNGKFLVVGGRRYGTPWDFRTTSRVFDPATNEWSETSPMPVIFEYTFSVALRDGRVVVAGSPITPIYYPEWDYWGYEYSSFEGTLIYDPANDSWSVNTMTRVLPGASSGWGADTLQLIPLTNDQVYFAGTYGTGSFFRPVHPPVVTGFTQTVPGTAGVIGLYPVSAMVTDADGDAIVSFTWKEGDTVLSTGSSAATNLALGVGTHAITLDVVDASGEVASGAVTIHVVDALDAMQASLAMCTASLTTSNGQVTQLQTQVTQFQGQVSQLQVQINSLAQQLAAAVGNTSFSIPGATPEEQVQNLATAIGNLNPGQKKAIYDALGGKKK